MKEWTRISVVEQRPFTAFITAFIEVLLDHRSFVEGIKILSPKVAECLYFPIGTMTGSFHTILPKYSRKNRSALDHRSDTSFVKSSGGSSSTKRPEIASCKYSRYGFSDLSVCTVDLDTLPWFQRGYLRTVYVAE